jgi:hypothetical protein
LVTGQAVEFRFFHSGSRASDSVGTIIEDAQAELEESARMQVVLPTGEGYEAGTLVPVTLHAQVTEVGTIELFMQQVNADKRWKLEFHVRTQR